MSTFTRTQAQTLIGVAVFVALLAATYGLLSLAAPEGPHLAAPAGPPFPLELEVAPGLDDGPAIFEFTGDRSVDDAAEAHSQDPASAPTTLPAPVEVDPAPPASDPEPVPTTEAPAPPAETEPPAPPPTEPPNAAPEISALTVESNGSQVTVTVEAADAEGDLSRIEIGTLGTEDGVITKVPVLAELDAQGQDFDGEAEATAEFTFSVSTKQTVRRDITVTATVHDTDGATGSARANHQVVRRVELVVSPLKMQLTAACFGDAPAVTLTGAVTVAGTGIDTSIKLLTEIKKATRVGELLIEQRGAHDGSKPWFVLVTVIPDMQVGGEFTNFGKISTLHNTTGDFVQFFESEGCGGSIRYSISATEL